MQSQKRLRRTRSCRLPSRNSVSCRAVGGDPSWRAGVQPLGEIEEVNMFKDDNTVIHFKRPQGKYLHNSLSSVSISIGNTPNSDRPFRFESAPAVGLAFSKGAFNSLLPCSPILCPRKPPRRHWSQ